LEHQINSARYNIDIGCSWFIGDTTVDVQTGINANMRTILVRTGKGGQDKKNEASPDFVFDNIAEAVDFILSKGC
jgi:phosphoglycolate phosphatase-like HAD superfamily hydrolase